MGGLMVLEQSHRNERLVQGYGAKDVDQFCENRVGAGYTKMGGGGNITPGGWLSRDPIKLRARLGNRWLTADYRAGDVLIFTVFLPPLVFELVGRVGGVRTFDPVPLPPDCGFPGF